MADNHYGSPNENDENSYPDASSNEAAVSVGATQRFKGALDLKKMLARRRNADESVKPLLEHLEDFRWLLLKAGAVLIVAMVVCLIGAQQIFKTLEWPLKKAGLTVQLQWFTPTGGVMSSLKIAFYAGIALALPFILFFIGQFILPALRQNGQRYFMMTSTIGSGVFLLGVGTCYFVILPLSLGALVEYNKWLGIESGVWRAEDFVEFSAKFMLGMGLLFEVPVLLLGLVRMQVLKVDLLIKARPYMLVINFVLCAVLTPADLLTTVAMAFALHLVYEVCILIARFWARSEVAKAGR